VEVLANSDKPDDPPDVMKNTKSENEQTDTGQKSDAEAASPDETPLSEKVADAHVEPEEDDATPEPDAPYLATERVDEPGEEASATGHDPAEASDHDTASDEAEEKSTEEDAAEDTVVKTGEKTDDRTDGTTEESDRISTAEVLAVGAAAGVSAGTMGADKDAPEDADKPAKTAPREEPRTVAASKPSEPKKASVLPMVLGGALVAMLGFFAGRSEVLDPYLPESLKGSAVDLAPLQEEIAAQQEALADQQTAFAETTAELQGQIESLATAVEQAAQATPEVPGDLAALTEDLAALAARIEALEARPVATAPDTENLATTDDVAGLQQALLAQEAELAALAERARLAEENATAEAQKVLARAALMRMSTAVEDGGAFGPELSALEEVAPVEVPEALRAAASEGVASLAELQADFAPAARAALAAARAEVPEAEVEGIGGFLRRQLSVRSVVPREGDDPDAVLSRAEAAVRGGVLGEALAELEALPESARAAMQEWIDRAATRQAVQEAAASLADSLTSN
jgi:hypothetical protein